MRASLRHLTSRGVLPTMIVSWSLRLRFSHTVYRGDSMRTIASSYRRSYSPSRSRRPHTSRISCTSGVHRWASCRYMHIAQFLEMYVVRRDRSHREIQVSRVRKTSRVLHLRRWRRNVCEKLFLFPDLRRCMLWKRGNQNYSWWSL